MFLVVEVQGVAVTVSAATLLEANSVASTVSAATFLGVVAGANAFRC